MNLVPHAAPTDTSGSLKEMVNRALEGIGKKKKLSLLGSTGSIGTQTLDIVRERPNQVFVTILIYKFVSTLTNLQIFKP